MDRIEDVIESGCEDQRADLKIFAETGDEDALSRIHFDGCDACDRAVDRIIELRGGLPPAPLTLAAAKALVPRSMVAARVGLAAAVAAIIAVVGFLAYMTIEPFFRAADATASEAERLQARIRFVPMPGFPGTCVAAARGTGGFGPTYFGAAPCTDVRDRFDADEGLTFGLREYSVVRIRGTRTCLAHASGYENDFSFDCGPGD